jgi:DNA-directed RNA polymerase sigma subunit (sigma70/sigma32)
MSVAPIGYKHLARLNSGFCVTIDNMNKKPLWVPSQASKPKLNLNAIVQSYRPYQESRWDKRKRWQEYKKRELFRVKLTRLRTEAIRYHEIVYLREIKRLTLEEVGTRFGITRERVRQLTCAEPKDDF